MQPLSRSTDTQYKARPAPTPPWYRSYAGCWILGGVCVVLGLFAASVTWWLVLCMAVAAFSVIMGFKGRGIARHTPVEDDVWSNLPVLPFEELQEILCPGGDWKQLVQAAQFGFPQWTRIAQDCFELMQTTTSPDTFFSRYQLLRDMTRNFSAASCVLKIPDCEPNDLTEQLDEDFEIWTLDFLERSRREMLEKATALKTESGRRNRYRRYYESILQYSDYLSGRVMDTLLADMNKDDIHEEELNK